MEFIYVSSNKNKYEEFKHLFLCPVLWERLELLETQGSLEEIALHKVEEARQKLLGTSSREVMIIVDDVSLCFKQLGCFPGPYIKHFLKIGTRNMSLLLKNISNIIYAECALGICYYDQTTKKMETTCLVGQSWGKFVFDRDENNENSFGFDKYFLPDNCKLTYGEMTFKEKNVISHRGQAILKLIKFCSNKKLLTSINN